MKSANEHDLVEGFREIVVKPGLGVGCSGQVYVADELMLRWANRVLRDTLDLLCTALDVPTVTIVTVVSVEAVGEEAVEAGAEAEAEAGEEAEEAGGDDVTLGDLVEEDRA